MFCFVNQRYLTLQLVFPTISIEPQKQKTGDKTIIFLKKSSTLTLA